MIDRELRRRTLFILSFLFLPTLCFAAVESLLRFTFVADRHAPSFETPRGYYAYDGKSKMFDIVPNKATTTHDTTELSYDVWSNEQGCFDTPFPVGTSPYIYLTGDSFTWGYTPFEKKWGTILEEKLEVRVAKCGLASVGTAEELLKASSTIPQFGKPSLIIVGYHGATDPGDDVWFERNRFLGESAKSRWVCDASGQGIGARFHCWLDTHSLLYNELEVFMIKQASPQSRGAVRGFLSPTYPAADPISEDDWFVHERSIAGFKELAKKHDAELLFILIPSANEIGWSATSSPSNARAKEILEQNDIEYVDLFPAFEAYTQTKGKRLYSITVVPFNEEGNRFTAEVVAQYIKENLLPFSK